VAKFSVSKGIQYILFFGLGILIFYFVYRGQDPREIWEGIKEFKIEWILLSFVFLVCSHIFRALRWRMMIQPLGYSPSVLNSFLAILTMYLANFVFPRLGEVSRCGVLNKYEKVPIAPQIGTVVTERIIDVLILILLLLLVVLTQFNLVTGILDNDRLKIGFDSGLIHSPLFWLGLLAFVILSIVMVYRFRRRILAWPFMAKLSQLFTKFKTGLLSVRKLKKPWLFALYSILIYVFYFLMTYSVFMGFGPTRELGPMAAFSVMAIGSVGMVVPVQGGIGTYHFFVIETLFLLGLTRSVGQLVALVLHGATTLFTIFIGLVALLVLPLVNRKNK